MRRVLLLWEVFGEIRVYSSYSLFSSSLASSRFEPPNLSYNSLLARVAAVGRSLMPLNAGLDLLDDLEALLILCALSLKPISSGC